MEAFDNVLKDNQTIFLNKVSVDIYNRAFHKYRDAVLPIIKIRIEAEEIKELEKEPYNVYDAHRIYSLLKKSYEESMIQDSNTDIFISHSEKDKKIADALIEIFKSSIKQLDLDKIFCSSVDGFKMKTAQNIPIDIKNRIKNSGIFILLLTKHSIRSPYTMFECGARWLLEKPIFSLACGIDLKKFLPPTLKDINAKSGMIENEMLDFVKDISDTLGLALYNPSKYNMSIKTFIELFNNKEQ